MRIYLSGKISGLNINTAKNFFKQKKDSFKWGKLSREYPNCEVINPFDIKPLFGIEKWFFYMCSDLYYLSKCDTIAMLPNWKTSKGAKIELWFSMYIFKQKIIWL